LLGQGVTFTNDVPDGKVQPETLADNDTEETVVYLKERIVALKEELEQMQQNMRRWKRKCLESVAVSSGVVPGEGVHVVQCASTAIEQLMHSEEQCMHSSGCHSEKACKEYQNAIALSIWTNRSTFYENLCHIIIAHAKCHLCETIFHLAKILMQMDLAGGTLSMEGLKVLRMCETDGKRYVLNSVKSPLMQSEALPCTSKHYLLSNISLSIFDSLDSLVAPSGFPDIGISVGNYGPERNSGGIDRISEEFRFSGILVFER